MSGEAETHWGYSILHVIAEGDSRSGSFSDIENDSVHSGLVYSSVEVSEGDASSIASLSLPCTLPVGDIRQYHFETGRETPSKAEEMLDLDGHFGEEILGNTTWYV